MTTSQRTLQQIITEAIEAAFQPVTLQQLYAEVTARVTFDADDLRPPMLRGEPTNEPAWRRNVRNALYDAAEHGRLVNIAHDQWQVPTPEPSRSLDVDAAWLVVRAAAERAIGTGEGFSSTQQGKRYRIAEVGQHIVIQRLDGSDPQPETLTEGEVRRAIVKLNAAGGRSGRRTLNYTVAKEVPLVHLHPALRWSTDNNFIEVVTPSLFPDEVPATGRHREGATKTVTVNRYERSSAARDLCVAHYGPRCFVCEMTFDNRYGEIGEGFIHVHHLNPLAGNGEDHDVDGIKDMRPVCPNCHAMLHQTDPPLKIEALRALLRRP